MMLLKSRSIWVLSPYRAINDSIKYHAFNRTVPQEVHRWFMEMFVDSMIGLSRPNVYGMAQFMMVVSLRRNLILVVLII